MPSKAQFHQFKSSREINNRLLNKFYYKISSNSDIGPWICLQD